MATHYDTPHPSSSSGSNTAGMIALAVLVALIIAGVYVFSAQQIDAPPAMQGSEQLTPMPGAEGKSANGQAPAPVMQPAQ